MTFRTHPEAEQELAAAWEYYAAVGPGLGADLLNEIEHGIDQIRHYPEAWPILRRDARRYLLRRFPYALVYRVRGNDLELVAVMHTKRRPDYWKERR